MAVEVVVEAAIAGAVDMVEAEGIAEAGISAAACQPLVPHRYKPLGRPRLELFMVRTAAP